MTIDLWILPNGPASYSIRDKRFVKGRTYRESDPSLVAQVRARPDTFGTREVQAPAPDAQAAAPAPVRRGLGAALAQAVGGRFVPPSAPAVPGPAEFDAPAAPPPAGDLPASLEDVREFLVPPAAETPAAPPEAPAPAPAPSPVEEAPATPPPHPKADAARKVRTGARRVGGKGGKGGKAAAEGAR